METEIVKDANSIAYCGLYCAECGRYKKGSCPGCQKNEKASWCKVRSCCMTNQYKSCADCKEFSNPMDCKKYNNFMAKLFGFVFQSDRSACINMIKAKGYENFAAYMAGNKLQTMKK